MARGAHKGPMADPGVGDIHAEPGSREWAIAVRLQLESKANSMGTGVNDVAMRLERLFTTGAWAHLFKEDGSTFASIEEYIAYAKPYGMGVPVGVMVRYLNMVREGRTVCAHLSKVAPADSAPCFLFASDRESVKVHPAAQLFQMLPQDALNALAEDIRVNGQREPIVLWDGQLLDGRNRLAACDLAGVTPMFTTLASCPDPLAYVLGANLHRRHLTDDDRALCAARMKEHYQRKTSAHHAESVKTGGRGKKKTVGADAPTVSESRWYDLAAADWHVSADAIKRADSLSAIPEIVEAVKVGTVTLSGGAAIAKAAKAGAVTAEEAVAAVVTKETAKALRDKIAADKPKPAGKGGGGKSKAPPAQAATAEETPLDDDRIGRAAALLDVPRAAVEAGAHVLKHGIPELIDAVERGRMDVYVAAKLAAQPAEEQREAVRAAKATARHPILDEIDGATDLHALDAAFNKVAWAGLSKAESAEASAAYQRRSAELQAQGTTTPAAPAPVSTQATTAQPGQATARQLTLVDPDPPKGPPANGSMGRNGDTLYAVRSFLAFLEKIDADGQTFSAELAEDVHQAVEKWMGP